MPSPQLGGTVQWKNHSSQDKVPHPSIDQERVIRVFMQAVRRGELVVFDMILDQSMIDPDRVEYIYTLTEVTPVVRVHSRLKQPVSLPALPDLTINSVSAILDRQGKIIETVVHCGN